MTFHSWIWLTALCAFLPWTAGAQHPGADSATPYAGFEAREIKSLSDDDIAELRRGGGWGLALPAELNGHPGPAHVLELRDELELTPAQVAAVEVRFADMRAAAVAAGDRFIAAEAALSDAFAGGAPSEPELRALLVEAAEARAALRFIHLSQHLATPDILSAAQIKTYNVLRGYADDPCTSVPEGHNATLWRLHNGCG